MGRMVNNRFFSFNRFFDRFRNRKTMNKDLVDHYERRLEDKDKIIKIQNSEIRALRLERKRLLDHFFSPIPGYEEQVVGNEVGGEIDVTQEDLYELKAGTIMEGEA